MSEKKRSRKRKEYTGPGEEHVEKPSKDEIKVAKWMKKNIKTKKTKFLSHNVEYFTSNKAIDGLMKSKFAEGDGALFTTREQAIDFLDLMLEHKFFHRAKKVPISIDDLRGVKSSKKEEKKDETKDKQTKKEKDERKDTEAEAEASGNNGVSDEAGGTSATGEKKEKKKRKIRLDMHPEQVFVDGSEAYVWIYDPIPIHYWIYGLILLLGAIGICMFPLWPPMLRKGVYYLSLVAAGFLVFILALTVVRLIIFTIVWAVTGGKLHFWIFPNLTEDVGFFASFWPLYESKYVSDEKTSSKSKKSKSKSKKKEKDSDVEDNDEAPDAVPLEPEKIEEIKEHDADMELRLRSNAGKGDTEDESHSGSSSANEAPQESDAKCSQNQSESESDGKDYEIISSSEVQNVK
ncbi:translocation protein SEC62 isoform X2 [Lucilia sericata]|uniref:translocation protein SEC62 isoform X2 n=1 Tax=Lucilia sericata TaxID=13632 RepID=UPI0018A84FB9|nr:translocation protein SEC62 isoform X2 [Lucilia sericata]